MRVAALVMCGPCPGAWRGGTVSGRHPLSGRRDHVRGGQVRQGDCHLLHDLQGRLRHHSQRSFHEGIQRGPQSISNGTHGPF